MKAPESGLALRHRVRTVQPSPPMGCARPGRHQCRARASMWQVVSTWQTCYDERLMNAAVGETMNRYYLDTEFREARGALELISIALVCDDGREFYAVSSAFDADACDPWVKANVLTHLPPMGERQTPEQIAAGLRAFINGVPEVWAWYASYDWVLFCWAMGGRMIEMPDGWPMAPMDLLQSIKEREVPRGSLPPQTGAEHNALEDARWLREACRFALGHQAAA